MSEEFANASAHGRAPEATPAALRDRLEADAVRDRRDAVLGLLDAVEGGHDLGDRTVAALAERAMGDPDPETRQFAVETLGVGDAGESTIRSALADRNEWVRAEAVVALSRTAGADAADSEPRSPTRPAPSVATRSSRSRSSMRLIRSGFGAGCARTDTHPSGNTPRSGSEHTRARRPRR